MKRRREDQISSGIAGPLSEVAIIRMPVELARNKTIVTCYREVPVTALRFLNSQEA